MKVRCVQDKTPASNGFLGLGAHPEQQIEGLTKGNTYTVAPVSDVSGDGNLGFGSISTEIRFLAYNDNGEWETYDVNLFEPI